MDNRYYQRYIEYKKKYINLKEFIKTEGGSRQYKRDTLIEDSKDRYFEETYVTPKEMELDRLEIEKEKKELVEPSHGLQLPTIFGHVTKFVYFPNSLKPLIDEARQDEATINVFNDPYSGNLGQKRKVLSNVKISDDELSTEDNINLVSKKQQILENPSDHKPHIAYRCLAWNVRSHEETIKDNFIIKKKNFFEKPKYNLDINGLNIQSFFRERYFIILNKLSELINTDIDFIGLCEFNQEVLLDEELRHKFNEVLDGFNFRYVPKNTNVQNGVTWKSSHGLLILWRKYIVVTHYIPHSFLHIKKDDKGWDYCAISHNYQLLVVGDMLVINIHDDPKGSTLRDLVSNINSEFDKQIQLSRIIKIIILGDFNMEKNKIIDIINPNDFDYQVTSGLPRSRRLIDHIIEFTRKESSLVAGTSPVFGRPLRFNQGRFRRLV